MQRVAERGICWERYSHDLPTEVGSAIWDSEVSINADGHREVFGPYSRPRLTDEEFGDRNVYVRRLLHLLADRDVATKIIAQLIGHSVACS